MALLSLVRPPASPPLVIDKTRMVRIGEERIGRNTLKVDMTGQGLADIRWMIQDITYDETETQIRLGNPPALLEVDRRAGKLPSKVDKKIEVTFGTALPELAMSLVENALSEAIEKTTWRRTGKLGNIGSSWQWTLIQGGRRRTVRAGQDLGSFGAGDMLILSPERVPYATIVNMRVARSAQLQGKAKRRKSDPRGTKRTQSIGFLSAAARKVRKLSLFNNFSVVVTFAQAHKVAGELSRVQGTGMIVIRAKRRGMGGGRRR